MFPHNRRDFLKRAAAITGGVATTLAIADTKASGRVLGANDRVRIAEIEYRFEALKAYQKQGSPSFAPPLRRDGS